MCARLLTSRSLCSSGSREAVGFSRRRVDTLLMWSARGIPGGRQGAGVALVVKVAFCICLAASLGARPLVEHLHYLFASHDHRFCPKHQRVEDVPRRSPGSAPVVDDERPHDANASLQRVASLAAQSHVACSVLNGTPGGGAQFVLAQSAEPLASCASTERVAESCAECSLRQCKVLALAPKRSPPPPARPLDCHC